MRYTTCCGKYGTHHIHDHGHNRLIANQFCGFIALIANEVRLYDECNEPGQFLVSFIALMNSKVYIK